MEVKSSKPVTLSKVKETLEKREKESELGYEQSQALEHAQKFSDIDGKKGEKLVEKLTQNEKIPEEAALKIIDIMPKTPATLQSILARDKIELTEEELEAVLKELS
ncbi:RNA polymerase Rpb4 family protein [Candidatus Micrarchaeota archaeon]|nr:RNA polymerase Rpb4 family protein [Candidatus Micrarchaeota archaeon]